MKYLLVMISTLAFSNYCAPDTQLQDPLDPLAEKYWYNNEAEISTYSLEQARYGEIREGQVAMVFVTEPFSRKSNTKADNPTHKDLPVMKLNMTKKFYTGVYPYSMMLSTFFPFSNGEHSAKMSCSVQEWCGHTFTTMSEKKSGFSFNIDSYFEGESAQNIKTEKQLLEDDVWTKIRLMPEQLPTGSFKMIPSLFTMRLLHLDTKAYQANISKQVGNESSKYVIEYPELERTLSINYENAFPHKILGWEETHFSGWGNKRQKLVTKASLLKTIKSDYWTKNTVADSTLRKELMLH